MKSFIYYSAGGRLLFEEINLNSQALTEQPCGEHVDVLCVQQLEWDTFLIGIDRMLFRKYINVPINK